MIHQYKNNGFNIVLDVNSGSVHVVDDVVYDVIASMVENHMEEEERAEFMVMLEGFAAALDTRDSLMIKAVWTGLKKALNAKKLCQKEVEKTNDVLRLYLVTK